MNTPKSTPEEICKKAFESIYPSCDRKDTKLLESLKDVFGNDKAGRIESFNKHKPILFIGGCYFVQGAVAYLWHTHKRVTSPRVLHCSGLKEDEAKVKISGDWIESTFTNLETCTYLGNVLFIEDLDPYEGILKWLWREVGNNKPLPGILAIGMDNTGNLPQRLLERFEVIELEPEKQSETAGISQDKTESEISNVMNETIFFDDETNFLWFPEGKKTPLESKDAEVLKTMINIIKSNNRCSCRREEILLKVYKVEVGIQQKLPKQNGALNSAISTINGNCKKELRLNDKLIQTDGKRMLKLSKNIEIRKM